MNSEIIDKLDEIISLLESNKGIKRFVDLKNILLKDDEMLKKIEKVQTSDYSKEYIEVKKEILESETLKEYKELERDLYFLVQEINKRLKSLTKEKKCENH